MKTILLQASLEPNEIAILHKDFPQYKIIYHQLHPLPKSKNDAKTNWEEVEIIYGNRLSKEHLKQAPNLHWIHNPTSTFSRLCMDEILNQGNIIVTTSSEEHMVAPLGEFVIAGILAFAKHLLRWKDAMSSSSTIWDSKFRDTMWSMQGRIFLQIGLDAKGTEIARCAKCLGLTVWGAQLKRSFHPHCERTFSMKDLDSILPEVDIVSICLPQLERYKDLLGSNEMNLIKNDSILIVIGAHTAVNEHALVKASKEGKFRGILLDVPYRGSLAPASPIWNIPDILITPEIADRPRSTRMEVFQTFHYNLRQYVFENFEGMRNRIDNIG